MAFFGPLGPKREKLLHGYAGFCGESFGGIIFNVEFHLWVAILNLGRSFHVDIADKGDRIFFCEFRLKSLLIFSEIKM